MNDIELVTLGKRIAALRIARQLKQTELAYEAGVSHRTLQRLESGEPVKSDGLLKVIRCLGRLESVLGALDDVGFSPYERLADAGLKVSELRKQGAGSRDSKPPSGRRRVRRSRGEAQPSDTTVTHKTVTVQWPEDQ